MASLIRHTCFNLLGTVVPLLLAVVTVPVLIRLAGAERFGFLALIWAIAGYAGLLDLGLSRTMARRVAKGTIQEPAVSKSFVWRNVFRVLLVAIVVSASVLFLWHEFVAPNLGELFDREIIDSSWCIAAMVPSIAATSVLRGVLEGSQRFGIVNLLRGGFTILAYMLLCVAALVKPTLPVLVGTMACVRGADFLAHAFAVRRALACWAEPAEHVMPLPLWEESGWFLCSQLIAPFMMYMDRFLISSAIGLVSVTYYTVPYELATKLLLIPIALSSSLFPRFANMSLSGASQTASSSAAGYSALCRTVGAIMFLPCTTLMLIGGDLLHVWVRFETASHSDWALVILAAGVWFNSVAQIPYAWLQARGLVKQTVQLHLIELLPYLGLLALGVTYIGIVAVAAVWAIRAVVDLLGLLFLAGRYGAPATDFRALWKLVSALLISAVASMLLGVYAGVMERLFLTLLFVCFSGGVLWSRGIPVAVRDELRLTVLALYQRILGMANVG